MGNEISKPKPSHKIRITERSQKNWLFIGSLRAGMRNANLMTLVANAQRHDLDVQEYLRDVIEHLNRGSAKPSELLPDVWKASHPEAIRTYREVERRDKAELAVVRNAKRKMLTRMLGDS